jgi:hypothetical protein
MKQFDHEHLEVYKRTIEFVVLANDIVEQLPRGVATSQTSCSAPRRSAGAWSRSRPGGPMLFDLPRAPSLVQAVALEDGVAMLPIGASRRLRR